MILFDVPVEVLCEEVFSYLSLSDLRSLNIAYTNKCCRLHLNRIWSIYKEPRYISICEELLRLRCIGMDLTEIWYLNFEEVVIEESSLWSYVNEISAGCPKLKVLNVTYDNLLTDEMVMLLVRGCPQLEELRLIGHGFSDAVITELAQHCHRLHALDLCCYLTTDDSIQSICSNCPYLRSIRIRSCNLTDASLIAIANTYPHLQSIDMTDCKFTDDGLIFFADKCRELRSVSVSDDNITSRSLAALWAANPNLNEVTMPNNASDDDIVSLAKSCAQVQRFCVMRCDHVTDAAVIAVAEHCTQLTSIEMANSDHISDASLIALGRHCHELELINVSSIPNITDVGVAALVAGCPLLSCFRAIRTSISDYTLALLSGCQMLECAFVRNAGVTADGVSLLKKQRPNCAVYG